MKTLILPLLLLASGVFAQMELPGRWIRPKSDEFKTKWSNANHSSHLSVGADFDGNGLQDSVLILEGKDTLEFGVWLFLQKSKNVFHRSNLYSTDKDTFGSRLATEHYDRYFVQRFMTTSGIGLVRPGLYKTACGKGYWECDSTEGNDFPEILIKLPGISFFNFDAGGTRYYYWDNVLKKIKYNWIDD